MLLRLLGPFPNNGGKEQLEMETIDKETLISSTRISPSFCLVQIKPQ